MLNKALTKRQLGLILLLTGLLAFAGILGVDVVDIGREGGIGPAQQIALGLAGVTALVGLSLIPLKDQLA